MGYIWIPVGSPLGEEVPFARVHAGRDSSDGSDLRHGHASAASEHGLCSRGPSRDRKDREHQGESGGKCSGRAGGWGTAAGAHRFVVGWTIFLNRYCMIGKGIEVFMPFPRESHEAECCQPSRGTKQIIVLNAKICKVMNTQCLGKNIRRFRTLPMPWLVPAM